jgi:hypothetical protein
MLVAVYKIKCCHNPEHQSLKNHHHYYYIFHEGTLSRDYGVQLRSMFMLSRVLAVCVNSRRGFGLDDVT